jgi:hypothetical protein
MLQDVRTINGSYGECLHEGRWLTNIYKMSAEVELSKEEIKIAGSRWTGTKVTSIKGTGSISGYKITSDLITAVGAITDDSKGEYRTELISKLDDPESFGHERIRLKNVSFDKIPLVGWETGSIVEEEWAFTFVGYELLDPISE